MRARPSMPSWLLASSRPLLARALNERSLRPPMSVTRPTLIFLAGAAVDVEPGGARRVRAGGRAPAGARAAVVVAAAGRHGEAADGQDEGDQDRPNWTAVHCSSL